MATDAVPHTLHVLGVGVRDEGDPWHPVSESVGDVNRLEVEVRNHSAIPEARVIVPRADLDYLAAMIFQKAEVRAVCAFHDGDDM